MSAGDILAQYIYVIYAVPIIALLIYSLFRNGIQGERRDDGAIVEEPSSIVRIIVLCIAIFGLPVGVYLLIK